MHIARCAALFGALTACYAPIAHEGAPCESSRQCPTPQRCVLGACSLHEGPPVDAAVEPPDAMVDARPPPDAMLLACSTAGLTCNGGTLTMFSCGGNCWVRCTANATRSAASNACSGWMGALGQIDDATENGCVTAHIGAEQWIGLTQSNTAATPGTGWTWNGVNPVGYTNWASGKPDDADHVESGEEQCAAINPDGTWDDQNCGGVAHFLCERPQL